MKKTLSTQAKEPIRLRSKKLANGNLFLYLDFYRDGKREYEFLKLYLVPEKTKADKIKNEETLRTANAIKAQKIVALQNEEHGFTVSGKSKIKFIDFMVVQAKNYEERGSYAYAQSIRNSIYHLRKYKGDAVTLRQVDKAYLLGYIDFLNTTGGKYNKSLSDAAKALYFDVVVIALNKAVKDEIIPTNPAHKINYKDRPQQGEATKQYLTFEEVKALVATPCKYEVLKQAFLFACFCGLRYSDIARLATSGKRFTKRLSASSCRSNTDMMCRRCSSLFASRERRVSICAGCTYAAQWNFNACNRLSVHRRWIR